MQVRLQLRSWGLVVALALAGCGSPLPPAWSWNRASGEFQWCCGSVRLPPGTRHQALPGDTDVGRFSLPESGLVIEYDIGSYAGAFANPKSAGEFEEWTVGGAHVWLAKRPWGAVEQRTKGSLWLAAVTFPNSGCANFYAEIETPEQAAVIRELAESFQPDERRTGRSSHCMGADLPGGD